LASLIQPTSASLTSDNQKQTVFCHIRGEVIPAYVSQAGNAVDQARFMDGYAVKKCILILDSRKFAQATNRPILPVI
jgi:hypothetical protein